MFNAWSTYDRQDSGNERYREFIAQFKAWPTFEYQNSARYRFYNSLYTAHAIIFCVQIIYV